MSTALALRLLAALCLAVLLPSSVSAFSYIRGYSVPYQASMPEQIAVDRFGRVYSLDFENNHVAQFDNNGTFLASFTTDNPPLKGPTGLAVDAALNVYVADSGNNDNNRIVKWNSSGHVVQIYGGAAYQSVAIDSEGFIYATVYGGAVVRMAQNGTWLQSYKVSSTFGRGSVGIDCDGQLLVADMWQGPRLPHRRSDRRHTQHVLHRQPQAQLPVEHSRRLPLGVHSRRVQRARGAARPQQHACRHIYQLHGIRRGGEREGRAVRGAWRNGRVECGAGPRA